VVSARFEVQLIERAEPPLLLIYAVKELARRVINSLRDQLLILGVWFELGENFEKIKRHPKFQDMRQLRLDDIQGAYLEKAVLFGRSRGLR